MKLVDFLAENVISGENLLIYMALDVGLEQTYDVEIVRGIRNGSWTPEYQKWLRHLDLEVERVGTTDEDARGNKHLLCIRCKKKRVVSIDEESD